MNQWLLVLVLCYLGSSEWAHLQPAGMLQGLAPQFNTITHTAAKHVYANMSLQKPRLAVYLRCVTNELLWWTNKPFVSHKKNIRQCQTEQDVFVFMKLITLITAGKINGSVD